MLVALDGCRRVGPLHGQEGPSAPALCISGLLTVDVSRHSAILQWLTVWTSYPTINMATELGVQTFFCAFESASM